MRTRSRPSPRRPLLGLSLLAGALGAASCTPPPPPPAPDGGTVAQCEIDLLYSKDTAKPVELGDETTGTLCPARDKDWYRFTVAEAGSVVQVHLWMDTHLTPVEPGYSILRHTDEGTVVPLQRDAGKSAGEAVDFIGAHRIDEPGEYLITVADVEGFDDRVDISNLYHLTVEVLPDPDANEPNERPGDATPLALDTATTGLIGTTGDADWYAFPVEADARVLDVTVRASADIGIDLVAELYGPDGTTLLEQRRATEDGTDLVARLRGAGTGSAVYYVRVLDEGGDDTNTDVASGSYEITASVLADPDPQEPNGRNDSIATAIEASSGESFTGAIASRSDQDFFRIVPPAGTSVNAPRVLLVTLDVEGGVGAEVQPQLRVLAHDPEQADGALPQCGACDGNPCLPLASGEERCGRVMLQRVLTSTSSHRTAYPLRSTRPVYVAVNDFGDDGFQENGTYSIQLEVVADPDPGERGDDYLIPNLQIASYDNSGELRRQTERSKERARDITAPTLMDSCPIPTDVPDAGPIADGGVSDGGVVDGGVVEPEPICMPVVPVPAPGPGGQSPWTVECDGQEWTMQAQGRLTYEGDRDFFRFDVPEIGYWALDVSYSTTSATPVELTFFVHSEDGLLGSYLEAQQTGGGCQTSTECDPGSVCVDGRCWADIDDNPTVSNAAFPRPGTDQCLYVHVNDTRPVYLEVTDNGINDFDLDMTYSFHIRMRCGCPAACDGNFSACQGVPPPQ